MRTEHKAVMANAKNKKYDVRRRHKAMSPHLGENNR